MMVPTTSEETSHGIETSTDRSFQTSIGCIALREKRRTKSLILTPMDFAGPKNDEYVLLMCPSGVDSPEDRYGL